MKRSLLFFGVMVFFFSCEKAKIAKGVDDRILVFGEETLWHSLKDSLNETYGSPWEVPSFEYKYRLVYKPISEFDKYKEQKNLMFLVANDQINALNHFVNQKLSTSVQESVKNNQQNLFLLKNVYAKGQLLLLFVVDELKDAQMVFNSQIKASSTKALFERHLYERIETELYDYEEDQNLKDLMRESHGYSVRAPYPFKMVDNVVKKDSNLVSIFKRSPAIEWVYTRKIEGIKPESFNDTRILDERDFVMTMHFSGDSIDRDGLIYKEEIELNGLKGLRLQGGYKYFDDGLAVAGGPFIVYGLYDDKAETMYLINGHVFNLGKRKSRDLMEVEAIMKTFERNSHQLK